MTTVFKANFKKVYTTSYKYLMTTKTKSIFYQLNYFNRKTSEIQVKYIILYASTIIYWVRKAKKPSSSSLRTLYKFQPSWALKSSSISVGHGAQFILHSFQCIVITNQNFCLRQTKENFIKLNCCSKAKKQCKRYINCRFISAHIYFIIFSGVLIYTCSGAQITTDNLI